MYHMIDFTTIRLEVQHWNQTSLLLLKHRPGEKIIIQYRIRSITKAPWRVWCASGKINTSCPVHLTSESCCEALMKYIVFDLLLGGRRRGTNHRMKSMLQKLKPWERYAISLIMLALNWLLTGGYLLYWAFITSANFYWIPIMCKALH